MIDYCAHGATLALFWFLAVDAVVCAAVIAAARMAPNGWSHSHPFAARTLPAASAIFFAAAVFLPSYWKFEPRAGVEGFDVTMTVAAIAAVLLVLAAAAQGVRAWRQATRRISAWMRAAEPFALPDVAIPAFRIDAPQPILALAGVFRSRLIVTSGLVDALTPEEFRACLAHELGHHRAWDNLKRLTMRCAPDFLRGTATAARLEKRWGAEAERRADAAISRALDDRAARLSLASALVKIARLSPLPVPHAEPICTLVGSGDITARVHDLVDEDPHHPAPRRVFASLWAPLGIAVFAAAYAPLLSVVHYMSEILVRALP